MFYTGLDLQPDPDDEKKPKPAFEAIPEVLKLLARRMMMTDKDDPEKQLNNESKTDWPKKPNDVESFVYKATIVFLGVIALCVIIGQVAITVAGNSAAASSSTPQNATTTCCPSSGSTNTLPDGIIAMGSAALGALAGILAPSPGKS